MSDKENAFHSEGKDVTTDAMKGFAGAGGVDSSDSTKMKIFEVGPGGTFQLDLAAIAKLTGDGLYTTFEDFVATPGAGAKTITLSSMHANIAAIDETNVLAGFAFSITAAGVVSAIDMTSVAVAGLVVTFANNADFVGTETILMGLGGIPKSYDKTNDSNQAMVQNPLWLRYIEPEIYDTFAPTGGTAYVEGTPIDMRGYNTLLFHYSKTASDLDDSLLRAIGLKNAADTVDYGQVALGNPGALVAGETKINPNVYRIDKGADIRVLPIPSNGSPFMRLDVAKQQDTGTDSTFTTFISKAFI